MDYHQLISQQYRSLKPLLLHSLQQIIEIPSVRTTSSNPCQPFGEPIDLCLDKTLEICETLGFETFKDPQGYYGYADIGQGDLVGVLCHIDVVPVDNPQDWIGDPFTLINHDNKLIARGIMDDKAPSIICLYALIALVNAGVTINKTFRFIFGTDEENSWQCINKYIQNEQLPMMGITPDADFPVIHAEKGLLQFCLYKEGESLHVNGGNALNATPISVYYEGNNLDIISHELQKQQCDFILDNDSITVNGKTVHAQSTELGINPITQLLNALYHANIHTPTVDFVTKYIHNNPYGELLLGHIEDDVSGKLKTNLAKIELSPQKSTLYFDFRIPVTYSIDDIVQKISSLATDHGFTYQEIDRIDPLYLPTSHPLIQLLCSIYNEEMNEIATPLAIGGATYSRAIPNFASFGMNFPQSEKTAHQTNEFITQEDMDKAFIIYAKTFARLNELIL